MQTNKYTDKPAGRHTLLTKFENLWETSCTMHQGQAYHESGHTFPVCAGHGISTRSNHENLNTHRSPQALVILDSVHNVLSFICSSTLHSRLKDMLFEAFPSLITVSDSKTAQTKTYSCKNDFED